MEEDDEFGDLYTDILIPPSTTAAAPTPPSIRPPIDSDDDDDQILHSQSIPDTSHHNPKTLVPNQDELPHAAAVAKADELALDISIDQNFTNRDESLTLDFVAKDENAGTEAIPGVSIPGVSDGADREEQAEFAEGDDWDSDSEDDLQIVLNDNGHGMGMGGGGEDGDDSGEPLVIVADGDQSHQVMEEQEWGEESGQVGDGERKEPGDAGKASGGATGQQQQQKVAYGGGHGYHPFHSQFKYVRPGATPMPGAAPTATGVAPGQLRPPVNMAATAGRGRGDWRPQQKGFHPGYGMPVWSNNAAGRGFGLDFTLPSHKTIFEVDIDSFEEKPWRFPSIDMTDFFNFGLNEETWKDYCKQLEQLRLEATMQSKIRVYESGRTEQEYDPDIPPELVAAAGINDVSPGNANFGKTDTGQSDLTKGSERIRPQLPTGRAIQVETGYGERLPSIDTRPPRIRDSDAIIEIVLQDSVDDDSPPGNDIPEQPDNDFSGEDLRRGPDIEEVATQEDINQFDSVPRDYGDRKRGLAGKRAPYTSSTHDNTTEEDGNLSFLPKAPGQYRPDARGKTSVNSGRNVSNDDRRAKRRERDRSPKVTPSISTQDKRYVDNQKEESVESVDDKHSPLSSPVTVETTGEQDIERKDATAEDIVLADGSSEIEGEEMALHTTTTNTLKDENLVHSSKKQRLSSQVEYSLEENDDRDDSKAARSSENSKARSGSSRDHRNLRDGVEDEVVQEGRSTRLRMTKRPRAEDEHRALSKDRSERPEMERRRMATKGKEDSYYRKNWDPTLAQNSLKGESIDRRKESDNTDGAWERKDEDLQGKRSRAEDTRKRERGDEVGSRHRSKVRENERSDKDENQTRKQLENGNWRVHLDKDLGSRQRDRDDNLKTRNESLDDLQSRRRKEEVLSRRDHAEKEDILHVPRESSSRRKRERDDILDQRKRDDQGRLRNDDLHAVRYKEEAWFQRERVERLRERDEWSRLKQSHEESLSKREREEARGGGRSGRPADDKAWVNHSRVKDDFKGPDREYLSKDPGRHSDQLKRRDRVENESVSRHRGSEDLYVRGNQLNNDERRSRQERANIRSDRAGSASDNHRVNEKKHKENTRKSKESEGDYSTSVPSRRNQEDHGGQISERSVAHQVNLRGMNEKGSVRHEIPTNRQSSKKHAEAASSDDEQQDSRRGRSKLERWTSHKERDFSVGTKSSSLKLKGTDGYKNGGPPLASKLPDEPPTASEMETVDNPHPLAVEKDGDIEIKSFDAKPVEDRHLDTVAKLKKRSERFKLPMPSEKEATAIKKMENEPLPVVQTETRTDSDIKLERPARKRRWTSN
ncbi:hypothetical protein RJ640_009444 [Escallonia rubra]|uniref:Pre-mRNA polyadenylation factor Fip1 domain-containing protein n=1 Tax=Escallonia rubra TaxID=112253 RepID=A0AA88R788_9ASTE|nr:hypothetical protein RJ640_009444 [Escallonia rubra]